ncbi:AcrR family transcriptional regulator [Bacillus pakistanensis]|uniref:AcrR family transcriptional regulator n=1 Tax=Rossellomorea pakistanensis TaxID=992288 RepID=A0ABS2NAU3_9BACI|nr:AcrR family transcriptional regulator [Bacillus pakistanensis]
MGKMTTSIKTKEAIIDAAIVLFNTKGYDGSSVRDIASRARVNSANISYYFHGKQGLLEECFTRFFETYLLCLENAVDELGKSPTDFCLKNAIKNILYFQSDHHLLSRFVWREMSIDSQIVREITSSYLMKEKYLLKKVIEQGIEEELFLKLPANILIIQLKSMLSMPYLNAQYLREVWQLFPQEKYFVERYYEAIESWIDQTLVKNIEISPPNYFMQVNSL